MAATQIESFCERCGTKYAFEQPGQRGRKLKDLGRTLGILGEEGAHESAGASRDPFHGVFRFCLECRQYTCPSCWNEQAGFCQGCVPLPESPDMGDFETAAAMEAATHVHDALAELRMLGTVEAWPDADLPQPDEVPVAEAPTEAEAATEAEEEPVEAVTAAPEPEPVAVASGSGVVVDTDELFAGPWDEFAAGAEMTDDVPVSEDWAALEPPIGEVQPALQAEVAAVPVAEPEVELVAEAGPEVEVEAVAEPEPELVAEVEAEAIAEPELDLVAEFEAEAVAEPALELVAEAEPDVEVEAEAIAEPELELVAELEAEAVAEPALELVAEAEPVVEVEAEAIAEPALELVADAEPNVEVEAEAIAEPKSAPIVELPVAAAPEPAPAPIAELPMAAITAQPAPAARLEPAPQVAPAARVQPAPAATPPSSIAPSVAPASRLAALFGRGRKPAPEPAPASAEPRLASGWRVTAPDDTVWPPHAPVYVPPAPPNPMAQSRPSLLGPRPSTGQAGSSPSGIRPCYQCALPLSASARFCRRCGTPQQPGA
jgi:hypothetical protein